MKSSAGLRRSSHDHRKNSPDSLKIVIYRLTQEALNNIAKHSEADHVRVALRENAGKIEITVQDNGKGFDLEDVVTTDYSMRGLGQCKQETCHGSLTCAIFYAVV